MSEPSTATDPLEPTGSRHDEGAETTDDPGDDVGRDPDAIASEIEATRSELAHTIDAIADKVSPKRAASRGASKVKEAAGSVRDSVREAVNGHLPATGAGGGAAGGASGEALLDTTASGAAADAPAWTSTTTYDAVLRKDRVAMVGGAVAVVVLLVLWRRHRG